MPLALRIAAADGSTGKVLRPAVGQPSVITVRHPGHRDGRIVAERDGDHLVLVNHSRLRLRVNGAEGSRFTLVEGDAILVGQMTINVIRLADEPAAIEVVEPSGAPLPNGVSDRQRKRVSASRPAEAQRHSPGFLRRMTVALANRGDVRRLDELERERGDLLVEAGRLSLSDRLGLSPRAVAAVVSGRMVSVQPDDLNRAVLDRWRRLRTRVTELDTEIAALRAALGLGPDPGRVVGPGTSERASRERCERTYETMDRTETEVNEAVVSADR